MIAGLVTTIVPVDNRPRQLVEAAKSVLPHDHRPIEIVIVDDGSTDETGAVADGKLPSFLQGRWWDTPTPFHRRSVCDSAAPRAELWLDEDWEYDCRVAALETRLRVGAWPAGWPARATG